MKSSSIIKQSIKTIPCLLPIIGHVFAKGLVGKLPGNPASCHEEPCSTDPQHVLAALKVMSVFLAAVLLLPLLLYYMSKLWTKIKKSCSVDDAKVVAQGKENLLEAKQNASLCAYSIVTTKPDIKSEPRNDDHKKNSDVSQTEPNCKSSNGSNSGISINSIRNNNNNNNNQDMATSERLLKSGARIGSQSMNEAALLGGRSNESLARQLHSVSPSNLSDQNASHHQAQFIPSEWTRQQYCQAHKRENRSSAAPVLPAPSAFSARDIERSQRHRYSMFPGITSSGIFYYDTSRALLASGDCAAGLQDANTRSFDRRRASHAAKKIYPESSERIIKRASNQSVEKIFTICSPDANDSKPTNSYSNSNSNVNNNNNNNHLQLPTLNAAHQHRHSIDSSILNSNIMAQQQYQQQQQQQQRQRQRSTSSSCNQQQGSNTNKNKRHMMDEDYLLLAQHHRQLPILCDTMQMRKPARHQHRNRSHSSHNQLTSSSEFHAHKHQKFPLDCYHLGPD